MRVENLAVIERTEARFGARFNAITGETGAGKSVLLSALGLALGGRADPDLVRRGAARAIASAAFDEPPAAVAAQCRALGVPLDDALVLSRELSASGRSAARANAGLVPITALRDLGTLLVDVQGQGASSMWLREGEQRAALDSLGGREAASALLRLNQLWALRQENLLRTQELRTRRERQGSELDQARRDLVELEAAGLRAGEDAELLQERDRLVHAARLREAASGLREALAGSGAETGAADRLAAALHAGRGVRGIDPELDLLLDQGEESVAGLRELQLACSSYVSQLPDDTRRLAAVEERLDGLDRVFRRHGGTLQSALIRRDQASALLQSVDEEAGGLEDLRQVLLGLNRELGAQSETLSGVRAGVARELARAVTADLRRLLMPKAAFQVRLWRVEDQQGVPDLEGRHFAGGPGGWDRVSFDLAANPGDPSRPLSEVASGGELSRVALALLSHLTRDSGVSTVVFDEIDQGLGGEAANRVGDLMREVADRHQVICITHLAPIAARADTHLVVAKAERDGRPHSEVVEVEGPQRVEELARLLAGEATPGAARAHAVELLLAVGSSRDRG